MKKNYPLFFKNVRFLNANLKTLVVTLGILFSFTCYGQWQQLTEPTGGYSEEIVKVGTSMFVTTFQGALHRSDNNGQTWYKVENGLPAGHHSYGLEYVNGVLYLQTGTSGNNLYRSADGGQTWTVCDININQGFINDITYDNTTLFAASADGIYKSTDNGLSWVYIPLEVVGNTAYSILFHNGKLLLGTDHLMVSEDEGATWSEVNFPDRGPNGIRSMIVKNDVIYIANSGKLWALNSALDTFTGPLFYSPSSITNLNLYDNDLYISGLGYYAYSSDNGANWNSVNSPNGQIVLDVLKENTKILTTGYQGVSSTENNGVTWTSNNSGINSITANNLNTVGADLITFVQHTGMLKSSDAGSSWINVNGNYPTELISGNTQEAFTVGNTLLVITNRDIYRSTDNGSTYDIVYASDGLEQTGNAVYKDGIFVVISKKNQLIVSTDNGATWTTRDLGELEINNALSPIAFDGQKMAIPSKNHKVLFSDDLGVTWVERSESFPSQITDLKFQNGNLYVLSVNSITTSLDNGITWENQFIGLSASKSRLMIINNVLYAIGNGIEVVDIDGGRFYDITENMDNIFIRDIAQVGNEVYISTNGYGIWKKVITDIPTDSDNDGVADVDDECNDTPQGQYVDEKGCSSTQLDDDNDGVSNAYDYCDNTPLGESVNGSGCSGSQIDTDGDGVSDNIDQCNYVNQEGDVVNEYGCISVPQNSVKVLTKTPTCPNEQNGSIEISTTLTAMPAHKITVTDSNNIERNYNLGNSGQPINITGLASGSYTIDFEIYGSDFNYTYIATVNELSTLGSGKRLLDQTKKTVSYELFGSKVYTVLMNGISKEFHFVNSDLNTITLDITENESSVLITGESDCQGKIEDSFVLNDGIYFYPTITTDVINFNSQSSGSIITVFNMSGTRVFEKVLTESSQISLDHLETGTYILHINTGNKTTAHKILKK